MMIRPKTGPWRDANRLLTSCLRKILHRSPNRKTRCLAYAELRYRQEQH